MLWLLVAAFAGIISIVYMYVFLLHTQFVNLYTALYPYALWITTPLCFLSSVALCRYVALMQLEVVCLKLA